MCEGNPVIGVQLAFFFHACFTDYENTFEMIDEPDYTVELITDANIGILLLKDWIEWADKSVLSSIFPQRSLTRGR